MDAEVAAFITDQLRAMEDRLARRLASRPTGAVQRSIPASQADRLYGKRKGTVRALVAAKAIRGRKHGRALMVSVRELELALGAGDVGGL